MLASLFLLVCIATFTQAFAQARVEVHFYDSGECGATIPSSDNYFFDEGTCYLIRNFDSTPNCGSRSSCLSQELEFDAYENCVSADSGVALSSAGSFEVLATATQKTRREYTSTDCSGNYVDVELVDDCDLDECGYVRSQVFPQTSNIIIAGDDGDDDSDDDDLSASEIAGVVIGSVSVVVLVCCALCCSLVCCVLVFLVCIMTLACIFAALLAAAASLIMMTSPKKNACAGSNSSGSNGKLAKSSPTDRIKEAGLNMTSSFLKKVPRSNQAKADA